MNKNVLRQRLVLGAALVYLLVFFLWGIRQAQQGDFFILLYLLFAVPLGLCFFVVLYGRKVKSLLLTAFSSFTHTPALPDEFADLDLPELERVTAEWELLGFMQRGDFAARSPDSQLGMSFSRLFEHESAGAIVEVLQQFTPTKVLPVNSLIQSFWGQRQQVEHEGQELERIAATVAPIAAPTSTSSPQTNSSSHDLSFWIFVTHTRASGRYFRLLRHPRILEARFEANTAPAQMWQFHRERAALIEARLETPVLCGDLIPLLRAHSTVISHFFMRRIRATPVWLLTFHTFSRKSSPPTYDGELAPLAP